MKSTLFVRFIPGLLWFILVFFLICLPKQEIPKIEPFWWFSIVRPDKIAHAFMFGVLNYLFIMPIHKSSLGKATKMNYFIWISIVASFWGLITEFIQLKVPGRSFDLLDWLADSVGVFIAFLYQTWLFKKSK